MKPEVAQGDAPLQETGGKIEITEIRTLVDQMLQEDSDLDDFCQDYFPNIKKLFTVSMSRAVKLDLLLEFADAKKIWFCLTDCQPTKDFNRSSDRLLSITQEFTPPPSLLAMGSERSRLSSRSSQRVRPSVQEFFAGQGYQILQMVEWNSTAAVWLAHDSRHGAQQSTTPNLVAIPILHEEHARNPKVIEAFYRAAHYLERLYHPSIAKIIYLPNPDETLPFHYYIREYLPGRSLYTAVTTGNLSYEAALRAVLQVGEALKLAHDSQILHRAVTPHNVFIDAWGQTRLLGFERAWCAERPMLQPTEPFANSLYTAPELPINETQMRMASRSLTDPRVDVYSLAVLLGFVVCREDISRYKWERFIRKVESKPGIAKTLASLIKRASAGNPNERPASVKAFCKELDAEIEELSNYAHTLQRLQRKARNYQVVSVLLAALLSGSVLYGLLQRRALLGAGSTPPAPARDTLPNAPPPPASAQSPQPEPPPAGSATADLAVIPALIDMDLARAQRIAKRYSFPIEIRNATPPRHPVIARQNPRPGMEAPRGDPIVVTLRPRRLSFTWVPSDHKGWSPAPPAERNR